MKYEVRFRLGSDMSKFNRVFFENIKNVSSYIAKIQARAKVNNLDYCVALYRTGYKEYSLKG